MSIFKGVGVAIVTPMNADGSVNYEALRNLAINLVDRKADAIIICGTTGETPSLSVEEHEKCVETVVKAVGGRVPVIAGAGTNNIDHAKAMAVNATKVGADALLVVTPYYNKATQKGLKEYYKAIAAVSSLPIIMYNVPSRTGLNIKPQTAIEIAREVKNVVAIKEASGIISQIAELASLNNGDLTIYSGNDDQTVPILSLGGEGIISVAANIIPEDMHDMVMAYLDGNTKKATEMQLKMIALIKALFIEVNPIPVKTALNILGVPAGPFRLPMCEMDEKNEEVLEKALRDYGLLK